MTPLFEQILAGGIVLGMGAAVTLLWKISVQMGRLTVKLEGIHDRVKALEAKETSK